MKINENVQEVHAQWGFACFLNRGQEDKTKNAGQSHHTADVCAVKEELDNYSNHSTEGEVRDQSSSRGL